MPHEEPGRAPRMAPDERREMLVDATLPLMARHGLQVTTRQIAEAAGVAEGTIFRAFPDKDALVRAAVAKALDAAPVLAELAEVDRELPLRERVAAVTDILQRRLVKVFTLLIAVGMHRPPGSEEELERHRAAARPQHEAVLAAVVRVLEPDGHRWRRPVPDVVRVLRLLTFAGSHPLISDGHPLTVQEITDVVLDGLLRHGEDRTEGGPTC